MFFFIRAELKCPPDSAPGPGSTFTALFLPSPAVPPILHGSGLKAPLWSAAAMVSVPSLFFWKRPLYKTQTAPPDKSPAGRPAKEEKKEKEMRNANLIVLRPVKAHEHGGYLGAAGTAN